MPTHNFITKLVIMYCVCFRDRCQVSEFMGQPHKMNSNCCIFALADGLANGVATLPIYRQRTMENLYSTSCLCSPFVPNSTREPKHSRNGCEVWKIFFFPCELSIFTLALLCALVAIPISEHTSNEENGIRKLHGQYQRPIVWQQASENRISSICLRTS